MPIWAAREVDWGCTLGCSTNWAYGVWKRPRTKGGREPATVLARPAMLLRWRCRLARGGLDTRVVLLGQQGRKAIWAGLFGGKEWRAGGWAAQ